MSSLQSRLIAQLDQRFGATRLSQLTETIIYIDREVRYAVRDEVLGFLQRRFPTLSVVSESAEGARFRYHDSLYILSVVPFHRDLSSVGIGIVQETGESLHEQTIDSNLTINGFGRIKRIEVTVPARFALHLDRIMTISETVISTIYEWTRQFIIQMMSRTETTFASRMYSRTRTIFSSQADNGLAESIWWASFAPDGGHLYALDRDATDRVLQRVSMPGLFQMEPSALATLFITTTINLEDTFARHAIASGHCVDANLAHATYVADEPEFTQSEIAIYQTKSITIMPVVREGDNLLVATFPRQLRSEIRPRLLPHLGEFARIFQEEISPIRRVMRDIRRDASTIPFLDAFSRACGRMLRAFLDG